MAVSQSRMTAQLLQDPSLLKQQAYIDGAWRNADSGRTFAVTNPATGEHLADVPDMGVAETRRAIEAAHAAFKSWRSKTAKERAGLLRKWFDLIMANQEDLGRLMTLEQGKPLAEARGEIAYGAAFVEWYAEEGKRIYGDVIPSPMPNKRMLVLKQPIGVVATITPWNFPNAMITRKVSPALAAGCTVVIKPAEETPLSALALAELATRAGIPDGVINIVTTLDAPTVGKELTTNPLVRKFSFTGSTPVGKLLMQQCSSTVKKVSLELGGNAPFIVFDDADLDAAVVGAIASKFRNAGQTCVCANRIYVQSGIYDEFAARFVRAVEALKIGNGLDDGVAIGPLINDDAVAKVERILADARAKGAKVATGGQKAPVAGSLFFQPTVLTGVGDNMQMEQEEIFGPLAPLYRFETEAEIVARANAVPFGLAAYVYTRDVGRVWRVSEELEFGIVSVNEGIFSTEVAPFGGVKESGIGREGSKYGIDDFVEIKYVLHGGLAGG
jgi:succinate-semialdehyde dehydrogenase/glutarate-semialdehyde dehydrogenase